MIIYYRSLKKGYDIWLNDVDSHDCTVTHLYSQQRGYTITPSGEKSRALISLHTGVWAFCVCLGHIPGIPGQLEASHALSLTAVGGNCSATSSLPVHQ